MTPVIRKNLIGLALLASCQLPTEPGINLYENLAGTYKYEATFTAEIPIVDLWAVLPGCSHNLTIDLVKTKYPRYDTSFHGYEMCPEHAVTNQVVKIIGLSEAEFKNNRLILYFPTDEGYSTIVNESEIINNRYSISGNIFYTPKNQLSGTWKISRLEPLQR